MTDEKIIDLYWARSEKAIEETDRAYGRYFTSIAYGILKNQEDAKETVNDTYLAAWNSMPPERPRHLKAFLGAVTRRLSINRAEYNRAKKRGGGEYTLVLDELAECVSGSEDLAESVALQNALNGFLRNLKPEPRRVFILRYWHMRSVEELATELGMSESRVKSMLMRTRKSLKKYLVQEGFVI
jgi:RNA polymerase sigma-70 factor (ECF subfamily)